MKHKRLLNETGTDVSTAEPSSMIRNTLSRVPALITLLLSNAVVASVFRILSRPVAHVTHENMIGPWKSTATT